jgi:oxygen-independent coproporphyrinogen III oxidase
MQQTFKPRQAPPRHNVQVALGVYISVPFCRTKCSYCNFASDVFSRAVFAHYVEKLCSEIAGAQRTAAAMGGEFERKVDTIYLGGGTPTVLDPTGLERIFATVLGTFEVAPSALTSAARSSGAPMLNALVLCGVNRVSLGVQSFVDEEARSVGRLHTRAAALDDIARLRAAGIEEINIDLIAGLPHQTGESWRRSLHDTIATGVPHVSVYMLEIDEESRLGRELIAGGTRYHAHFVPDEELTVELYLEACEQLNAAGIRQYEISNFARPGHESRHNLKYWTRQPYLGFGVDAHSMLAASADPYVLLAAEPSRELNALKCDANENENGEREGGSRPCAITEANVEAIRFCTPDSLEAYLSTSPGTLRLLGTPASTSSSRTIVSRRAALEEEFFLGLRLVRGVDLRRISLEYGHDSDWIEPIVSKLVEEGLLDRDGDYVRLTERGRLLSNEVFARFV